MDEDEDDEDRAAIAALWVGARPRVLDRIGSIDVVIEGLAADTPAPEAVAVAAGEAHKLAGSLGTYGMPDGSRLAKELELLLEQPAGPADAPDAARLSAELRAIVETGPA